MDHDSLVYKVNNSVQSSLLSSHVLTLIQGSCQDCRNVKIVKGGLCSFLFSLFYFSFFFYSLFLFLEQLRLGVISHTVTSVTT